MKKYKKKEKGKKAKTKLLQIRLSKEEHERAVSFIEKFDCTQREWLLAVLDEIREANLLINGEFYLDWKDYAYCNNDKWDKKITTDSVCEECGVGYYKEGIKKYEFHQLERHHYAGYIGENAFKVQILCRKCHALKPKSIDKKKCDICQNTRVYNGMTCPCTGAVTGKGLY